MNRIVEEMLEIWGTRNIDWMGYCQNNGNKLSYHHLIKKEYGGLETIDNGALLYYNTSHQYLHIIEYKDFKTYMYITNILTNINNQRSCPTKEQLKLINEILLEFEYNHKEDVNARGKPIIRERYLKREYNDK